MILVCHDPCEYDDCGNVFLTSAFLIDNSQSEKSRTRTTVSSSPSLQQQKILVLCHQANINATQHNTTLPPLFSLPISHPDQLPSPRVPTAIFPSFYHFQFYSQVQHCRSPIFPPSSPKTTSNSNSSRCTIEPTFQ